MKYLELLIKKKNKDTLLYNNIAVIVSPSVSLNNSFFTEIPNLIWSSNPILEFLDIAGETSSTFWDNRGSVRSRADYTALL